MQLLQDTFIIENLQVLSEGKSSDKMRIKGVFGRCNEKNNNGRIYPTAVLESQLAKVQPMISERRLCGELDHPQNDTVKLSNASHLITKLEMKGDELIGEAEILKTPAGLTAAALVNGGVKIGISSRGMGTLSENETGEKVVNEDFRLVTFDLVADPSTRGAYPGLSESTESKYARETQGKLTKESNFVTMLESKMKEAYQPWIDESRSPRSLRQIATQTQQQGSKLRKPKTAEELATEKALAGERKQPPKPATTKEALELVKADGHWHRIAEMIVASLVEDLSTPGPLKPGQTAKGRKALWASRASGATTKPKGGQPKDEDPKDEDPKAGATQKKVDEDNWIQDAEKDIEKRGTEGVCTGDKFGGPTCPPGSKRYNLAKTFKKMGKKKVAEAFETETDQERLERAKEKITPQAVGTKGPGFRDRMRIKAGKRAEAQGDVQASRIRRRGEAGGNVGLRAKLGLGGAGSARYSQKSSDLLRKRAGIAQPPVKKPGVLDRLRGRFGANPEPPAAVPKRDDIPQATPGQQGMVPGTLRDRSKVKPKGKPKMSDEDKYSAKVAGKEELRRATANVRAAARSDSAGKTGEFGSGVKSQEDKDIAAKAIARRERKSGKKVNLTPQQKLDLGHTSYKQIGNMLAEMMHLKEDEAKPKTRKLKSGEYGRRGYGGGPRKKTALVTQDETQDKREQGSTRP